MADLRLADGELLDMMKLSDLRQGRTLHLLGDTPWSPTPNRLSTALPPSAVTGSHLVAEPDEVFTPDGSVSCRVGRLAYTRQLSLATHRPTDRSAADERTIGTAGQRPDRTSATDA